MEDLNDIDMLLPERLFATDRYPLSRLKVYSDPNLLCSVRKSLQESQEWFKLIKSYLGPLMYRIPINKYAISGELIHALLCRQVVTSKKYEMWTVFGGQPLRFSIKEFAEVTGLACHHFPEDYDPDYEPALRPGEGRYWLKLFGNDKDITLDDVTKKLSETTDMSLKLRLSLLLIVDGVLISTHQEKRPTPKYVEMLEDLDSFLQFPWGRESFLKTINAMILPKKSGRKQCDPKTALINQLQQQTISLVGFPIALQLLAYQNIPALLAKMVNTSDESTFFQCSVLQITEQVASIDDIHSVEQSENLVVVPLVDVNVVWDGSKDWEDEKNDSKIDYLLEKILTEYHFRKTEWPGGFDVLRNISAPSKKEGSQGAKNGGSKKRKKVGGLVSRSMLKSKKKKVADNIPIENGCSRKRKKMGDSVSRSMPKSKKKKEADKVPVKNTCLTDEVVVRLASLQKKLLAVKEYMSEMERQLKTFRMRRRMENFTKHGFGIGIKKHVQRSCVKVLEKSATPLDASPTESTHVDAVIQSAGGTSSEDIDD